MVDNIKALYGGSRSVANTEDVNRYDFKLRPVIILDKLSIADISREYDLPVYTEYTTGQTITLGTRENAETFYVIEDSDYATSTLKLLTFLPVETTNYKQTDTPDYPRFDDNDSDYETSEIAVKVGNYKTALEIRINKTVQEARLMMNYEASTLHNNGYKDLLYGTTKKWDYWINEEGLTNGCQCAVWRNS